MQCAVNGGEYGNLKTQQPNNRFESMNVGHGNYYSKDKTCNYICILCTHMHLHINLTDNEKMTYEIINIKGNNIIVLYKFNNNCMYKPAFLNYLPKTLPAGHNTIDATGHKLKTDTYLL